MRVTGQRIVIFGDSLSHPGSDNGPTQSIVTQGTSRLTSAPGDMLGSILLEQGAEAVLIDARVGRSAYNYWARENTQELMADVARFAPTKAIVMLGTNDVGNNLDAERQAFTAIRDNLKAAGAEVWAVGPLTYVGSGEYLNAQTQAIYDVMHEVFGARLIDGRALSINTDRAGDGVHFTPASAGPTAQNIAGALLATNATPWWAFALGAAGVVTAVWAGWSLLHKRTQLSGLALPPAPTEPELTNDEALMVARDAAQEGDIDEVRKIIKQLPKKDRQALEAKQREGIDLFAQDGYRDFYSAGDVDHSLPVDEAMAELEEQLDKDAWLEQNEEALQDWALDLDPEKANEAWEGWKSNWLSAARNYAVEWLDRHPREDLEDAKPQTAVEIIDGVYALEGRKKKSISDDHAQADKSKPATIEEMDAVYKATYEMAMDSYTGDDARYTREEAEEAAQKSAEQNTWDTFAEEGRKPNTQWKPPFQRREATDDARQKIWALMQDPDPSALDIAEDLALQNGIKLRDFGHSSTASSAINGAFLLSPINPADAPLTKVYWKVTPFVDREAGETYLDAQKRPVNYKTEIEVFVDSERVFNETIDSFRANEDRKQTKKSREALIEKATQSAVNDAWQIAKLIKSYGPPKVHSRARASLLRQEISLLIQRSIDKKPQPKELYGKIEPSFHELVRDEDPNSMQVAEDFMLEKGWKIREVAGGKRHGHIEMGKPGAPRAEWRTVAWHTPEPGRNDPMNTRKVEIEILWGKQSIKHEGTVYGQDDYATKVASAEAWAIAKAIKGLPLDIDEATLRARMEKALDRDVMVPEELFDAASLKGSGLGAVRPQQRKLATSFVSEAKKAQKQLATKTAAAEKSLLALKEAAEKADDALSKRRETALDDEAWEDNLADDEREDPDVQELRDRLEEVYPPETESIDGALEAIKDDWNRSLSRFGEALEELEAE